MSLKPYLQLTRPANLVTAVADILAGISIAGFPFATPELALLLLATVGLYGGGVVLNDVFDASLDAVERPERPIPSGRVPFKNAVWLGLVLLLSGVLLALVYSFESGLIAMAIALLTVIYNRFAKHSRFFGPLVMGMCRGGNLLLGISSVEPAPAHWWPLALVPIVYIAAITMISQDEVHGGKRPYLILAAAFYAMVHGVQLYVSFLEGNLIYTWILVASHAYLIGLPLYKAIVTPTGPVIGKAVKAGVLALIVMNAAWCVAFGDFGLGIIVLTLLPFSRYLAGKFAVT